MNRLARPATTLLSLCVLAACQTPRAQPPLAGETNLATAEYHHRAANRAAKTNPTKSIGLYLAAAEFALEELRSHPAPLQSPALDLYNLCVAQIALLHIDSNDWTKPLTVTGPGRNYTLTTETPRKKLIDHRDFDSLVDASSVKLKEVDTRHTRHGLGAPLVAYRKGTPERVANEPFLSETGLAVPVTATLHFSENGRADLAFHRVEENETVRANGRTWPLAADFTAPLAALIGYAPKENIAFKGMLDPSRYIDATGLFQTEPFDPDKIPVILVHGLKSSPMVWANAYNSLRADPLIHKRYQFFFYRYPTGFPIGYNSANFRKRLAQFREHYDPARRNPNMRRMVLVGHSMGGILSNGQTLYSGDTIRNQIFEKPPEELDLPPEQREVVKALSDFKPNPDIARVIFVCSPHRGSKIADGNIGRLGSKLVKYPLEVVLRTETPIMDGLTQMAQDYILRQQDSIDDLEPHSQTLETLLSLERRPQTIYHSIIGDRGRGDPPTESSDGVVPYWSSHLDYVASEKIVPYDHGAPRYPETIEEIRRILREHLDQ